MKHDYEEWDFFSISVSSKCLRYGLILIIASLLCSFNSYGNRSTLGLIGLESHRQHTIDLEFKSRQSDSRVHVLNH